MAKCKLEKAAFNNSLDELEVAIRKCEKVKVPADDDELVSAKKRLEYLKLKKGKQLYQVSRLPFNPSMVITIYR